MLSITERQQLEIEIEVTVKVKVKVGVESRKVRGRDRVGLINMVRVRS